jgi:hypothetical protein
MDELIDILRIILAAYGIFILAAFGFWMIAALLIANAIKKNQR